MNQMPNSFTLSAVRSNINTGDLILEVNRKSTVITTNETAASGMDAISTMNIDNEHSNLHTQRRCNSWADISTHHFFNVLFSKSAVDQFYRLWNWTGGIMEQYVWRSQSATKFYAKNFIKVLAIAIQAEMVKSIPVAAALSDFNLYNVGPSVFGQLAQGAVVACFAVLLTRATRQRPIDSLADGPLSSVSCAYWLWANRGSKSNGKIHQILIEIPENFDPKLALRQRLLSAIPGIALTLSSFVVYFLLSLGDDRKRKWALLISIFGIISEILRLLATWLTISSMKTKPSFEENKRLHLYPESSNDLDSQPFVVWRPNSVLRPLRLFSDFTNGRKTVPSSIYGVYSFTWCWTSPKAMVSVLIFCTAASLIVLSTGALICSGDTSMEAASLGILLCLSASGFFRIAHTSESDLRDVYTEHISATLLKDVILNTFAPFTAHRLAENAESLIMKSLIEHPGTVTLQNETLQTFNVWPGSKINMHEVFYYLTGASQPVSKLIMHWRDRDTELSPLLEIADALYCRALLMIKHAHVCNQGKPRRLGSKCNVDSSRLMSAVLLASGHAHCSDVSDILKGIKDWMQHEDLLWSIIGTNMTLDMMVLPPLRKQLESTSNTLDLALRVCHMAMYESIHSGDMLEAVPTALYYLLTGSTALGSSTARMVELAIRQYGAVNMVLSLDRVTIHIEGYEIFCHGKLHDWPGGFIPVPSSLSQIH